MKKKLKSDILFECWEVLEGLHKQFPDDKGIINGCDKAFNEALDAFMEENNNILEETYDDDIL